MAISPDGRTIATAGWRRYEWEKTHTIYLFDRDSGRLVRRIPGLPNVVYHLVHSKDGRFLVATLGGENGIRVYRTSDHSLVAEAGDYGNDSYGADFDSQGRLVTTSYDGFVRSGKDLSYLLPVDAQTEQRRQTAVPFSEIKNTGRALAGMPVVFVDTCHAGNVMGARGG